MMGALLWYTLLFSSTALTYLLYVMPWVTGYWKAHGRNVTLDKGVVVVSDVHLGRKATADSLRFLKLIGYTMERLKLDTLVIAGDLIDKRIFIGERGLAAIAKAVINYMSLRGVATRVLYLPSRSAHDVVLKSLKGSATLKLGGVEFCVVMEDYIKVRLGNCQDLLYILHGDYIFRDGRVSHFADLLSRAFAGTSFTGLMARRALGVRKGSWLILGHSHVAQADVLRKVVSLGSWIRRFYAPPEKAFAVALCNEGNLFVELIKID